MIAACSGPEGSIGRSSTAVGDWMVLFDGTSTEAFRGYGEKSFPSSWVVDDRALRALPVLGVDLITVETFADFDLEFEWRVGPAGNSGVIYRVTESDSPSWTSGVEYQVLDDAGHPDGSDPRTSAGALYGLLAPSGDKRLVPIGEYNSGRIVVRGGRVEHWLNGTLVLEYDWSGPDVRSWVADSKFRELTGFMTADEGHLVLQHHGEEVWFRNVRVRRLS